MNEYQTMLYNDLIALTRSNEAFYFQDFQLDGKTYRIFNYRLASYTDFQQPGALQCRGVMFEVNGNDPVRLASLPMGKFFNLNENPMTIGLDLSKVDAIETKADGSLMSTYVHDGKIRLKSKGSLFSEQAIDAMNWLKNKAVYLASVLWVMDQNGWTINLEWCAPHNRIVIGYDKPQLKILNMRNRSTGEYMSREQLESVGGLDADDLIERVDTNGLDVASFVESVPAMQDNIEGFVCRIGDLWFKIKTDKYLSLHHAKDSVNNPRRLFEAVLDEGVDDLRSMFHSDPLAMKTIDEMQVKVDHVYNSMVKAVESFYEANKELTRKEYAIKGQQDPLLVNGNLSYFGLAMNKYIGKPMSYKEFLKGKWKELGLKDEAVDL